jgi:hypothetical protein
MTTANKFLEQPARGSNVGVWDTPVNGNTGIIDNSFGGVATIALGGSPVVLSSAQYQCVFLVFNGALSANVAVTFPAVGSFYTIQNLCTASSAFIVTAKTTAGGSQQIGLPFGEACDVFTDGSNVKYRDIGRVGTYWDYAGSSVPSWVTACTVPPYLNCDGTSFSSATYPQLATILGGTTLPDLRGRYRAYLNQGTGRITSGTGGIDGNTILASGGVQGVTLSSQNIPPVPINDPGHTHSLTNGTNILAFSAGVGPEGINPGINAPIVNITVNSNTTGISAGNNSPTAVATLPPSAIGGLSLIRAG